MLQGSSTRYEVLVYDDKMPKNDLSTIQALINSASLNRE